jgi:inorganic pyrophosphatase
LLSDAAFCGHECKEWHNILCELRDGIMICTKQKEQSTNEFWTMLAQLVAESELVVDRPKGSAHPRYPDFVYPLDYGYLKGTSSADGGGIDVWKGSSDDACIDAVVCTVDFLKRDSEIKILIGCTEVEIE